MPEEPLEESPEFQGEVGKMAEDDREPEEKEAEQTEQSIVQSEETEIERRSSSGHTEAPKNDRNLVHKPKEFMFPPFMYQDPFMSLFRTENSILYPVYVRQDDPWTI